MKKIIDIFIRDISALGSLPNWGLGGLFLLIFGFYNIFYILVLSFIFEMLILYTIRYFYFRTRPKPQKYTNIFEKLDASSFPSVHSSRAGILAVVSYLFLPFYAALVMFIIAFLICMSRIYMKKHHLSDVVVGFIFGTIFSYTSYLIII